MFHRSQEPSFSFDLRPVRTKSFLMPDLFRESALHLLGADGTGAIGLIGVAHLQRRATPQFGRIGRGLAETHAVQNQQIVAATYKR